MGLGALLAALAGGCQNTPQRTTVPAVGGAPGAVVEIDDLMPVDCLLPPRVKVLGGKVYTEARRPLKTTAADCRIRGGEYVAYDRADYRWALKVWLPAAEAGDPEAQTYVGEIYESGVGGEPQYSKALEWYRRAAAQGYRRAMLKLGHLYEKGLGVRADPLEALNWYRRGSGLEDEGIAYASTLEARVAQAVALRMQRVQRELERARQQVRRLQQELGRTQRRLETLGRKPARPDGEGARAAELEQILQRQKRELHKAWLREAELKRLLAQREAEISRLERELKEKQRSLAAAAGRAADAREKLDALYRELDRVRQDPARVARLEEEIARREASLQAMQARVVGLESEIARLKAQLAHKDTVAVPGPSLEIVQPPVLATRGKPRIRLRSVSPPPIVGRVSAPAGLERLSVNGQEQLPDANGLFRIRLRGVREEMPMRVEAVDSLGRRALLEFVAVPGQPTPAPPPENPFAGVDFGRYHALVIGAQDYRNVEPLQSAVADARAVHRVLRERFGFDSRLLLNPTRAEMISALAELHARLGEKDNLLVYYAGHGRLMGDKGYWLPVDAREDDPGTWIANRLITDYLKIMKARHVLIIADSCYAGALSRMAVPRPLEVPVSDRIPPKWVRAMVERRSRNVLTSGGLEPVLDMGAGGHSVFANALLKVLRGGGHVLDGYRLYQRIFVPVQESAARYGVRQVPTYAAILGDGISGEFFFVARQGGGHTAMRKRGLFGSIAGRGSLRAAGHPIAQAEQGLVVREIP